MVDRQTDELVLVTGAAHHFVSSSFANQPALRHKEGKPFLEIHPKDAAARDIETGDELFWSKTSAVGASCEPTSPKMSFPASRSPKGYWSQSSLAGRNVNWLTTDVLADIGNQASFHSNLVRVRKLGIEEYKSRIAGNALDRAMARA